jgi:hypothetical protein
MPDIEVVPKYWAKRDHCNCHPEACCCDKYLVLCHGDKLVSCYDKAEADTLCAHLNRPAP